jgi:hypothetical protein
MKRPLKGKENEIIELVSKQRPGYLIARRYKVSQEAIRRFIRIKNLKNEVIKNMGKKLNMQHGPYISITEALETAKNYNLSPTRPTLLNWIQKNNLGVQPGGSGCAWCVNLELFTQFLERVTKNEK